MRQHGIQHNGARLSPSEHDAQAKSALSSLKGTAAPAGEPEVLHSQTSRTSDQSVRTYA